MPLHLIDALSAAGNPARPNDDAWCAAEGFAAVLDGATGLGGKLLDVESDAAWCAQRGAELLARHAPAHSGRDLLRAALTDLEAAFVAERLRPPSQTYELPMASMMTVQLMEDGMLEAQWFGDCSALVMRPGEPVQLVGDGFDQRTAEQDSAAAMAAAHGVAPAGALNQPAFLAALRAHRNTYNRPGGLWVFAPDVRCADHAASARIEALPGALLLLASDGFTAIATDYGAYSADELMQVARARGLQAVLEELRALEEADPEGRRHPRFKKSDDATALLVRVEA